jgi:hypothetical protein
MTEVHPPNQLLTLIANYVCLAITDAKYGMEWDNQKLGEKR